MKSTHFVAKHVDFSYRRVKARSSDDVVSHANDVISLGLFYSNYKDAVKEGDGHRVKLCWKYLLPIFKASDKRNYSGEVLRMLYSCNYTLSPHQTQQLLYSWFINTHELPGRNIAADLHMEHLNRACKEQAIKGLGANKTEKSITRIGKAIGPLFDIQANFDHIVLGKEAKASRQKVTSSQKDMNLILVNLQVMQTYLMKLLEGDTSISALQKSLFHKVDHKTLESWIEESEFLAIAFKCTMYQVCTVTTFTVICT